MNLIAPENSRSTIRNAQADRQPYKHTLMPIHMYVGM